MPPRGRKRRQAMATSDIHALSAGSVDLSIGGRQWKVGRLSILDVLGEFGKLVRERRLVDIVTACSGIQDKADRQDMVKALMRDVPKGKELEEEARQAMDTVEGGVRLLWLALRKGQPCSIDEAMSLATEANAAEVSVAIEFAMGGDLEEIKARVAAVKADPSKNA